MLEKHNETTMQLVDQIEWDWQEIVNFDQTYYSCSSIISIQK